jgi:hypothetical protein
LLPITDFDALRLSEDGFGLDTEIVARLLRSGVRPFEVPVSYDGRSVQDGKKIRWRDGIWCLSILIKVRVQRRLQPLSTLARRPVPMQTRAPDPAPTGGSPTASPPVGMPPQRFGDNDSDDGADAAVV